MQILGKRSRVLMTMLCAVMLIAIGISFAAWDGSAVKADGGNMSDYANAKVGDIVTFGRYYDYEKDANGDYVEGSTVIDKYPMTWIVVDKNERTGQLTLMSQYIIACGSYFGNHYINKSGTWGHHYSNISAGAEVSGVFCNQAYCDSTIRAFLNNLERLDMGGDQFIAPSEGVVGGYVPSGICSTADSGLLSSIGYSNRRYWTGLTTENFPEYASIPGFFKREDANSEELYYQRPLDEAVFIDRPAAKGFYDEAFSDDEKARIVPKKIPAYIGNRWPDYINDVSTKKYVEGALDKVWIPSVTELNAMMGHDWNGNENPAWTNPSDDASLTVFEYFKNATQYKNPYENRYNLSLEDALKGQRNQFSKDAVKGNYSVPLYEYKTTTAYTDMGANSSDFYWTRSPSSAWFDHVFTVDGNTGWFPRWGTDSARVGVRPCLTLQY